MSLKEIREDLIDVQTEIRSYFVYSEEYLQLKIFKIYMRLLTGALQTALIGLGIVLVLFFASLGISLALGVLFDSYILGFLTVAAFYALVTLLLYLFRNRLHAPVLKKFSTYYFDEV